MMPERSSNATNAMRFPLRVMISRDSLTTPATVTISPVIAVVISASSVRRSSAQVESTSSGWDET